MNDTPETGQFGPFRIDYDPETHELKVTAVWRRSGSLLVVPRSDNAVCIRTEQKPLAPGEKPIP